MEEKLLPTTLYSDGNDEFQRVSGHFVIDQVNLEFCFAKGLNETETLCGRQ